MNKVNNKGFTLVEIMTVVVVFLVILSSVIALSQDKTPREDLEAKAREVVDIISRAHNYALTGYHGDNWGIQILDNSPDCADSGVGDCAILYKGLVYASRNTAYDESFRFDSGAYVDDNLGLAFKKSSGWMIPFGSAPSDGLLSYHALTQTSLLDSNTFEDKSGNSHDGDSTNTPTFGNGSIGDSNGAMVFNGTTDVVDGGSDYLGANDITISAWVYADDIGEGGLGHIVSTGQFALFRRPSPSNYFRVTSNFYTNQVSSGTDTFPLDTWLHIAVTRTSAGLVTFYINGVQTGTPNQNSGTPTVSGNYQIGNGLGGARTWDGSIAHVRIYSRILDPNEIIDLYQEFIIPTSTSSYLTDKAIIIKNNFNSQKTVTSTLTGLIYFGD